MCQDKAGSGVNEVATAGQSTTGPDSRELLLGYVRVRRETSSAACAILKESIARFAEREGYCLSRIFVGVEGKSDLSILELLDDVRLSCADAVLVLGPAQSAMAALQRLSGVRVLTLADVSPVWR
jgi:hypothetical protein